MKTCIKKPSINMYKSIIILLLITFITSCSTKKNMVKSNKLYEVLISEEYGGANFKFYELITEANEFKMLLGDDRIKEFINKDDITNSNFILVNMGEKSNGGYRIEVENVEELEDKIIVTIKEIEPKAGENVTMALTNPYAVIKINSKKPIEFK
jgi:hypothetical protein